MSKSIKKIEVSTVPNGYTLTYEGESFMYFNEIELLAGFLSHVGMDDSRELDRGTLLSNLFSMMIGQSYTDNVTTLRRRVNTLSAQYTETVTRMDDAIKYVGSCEAQIKGFVQRLKAIDEAIQAQASKASKTNRELSAAAKHWAAVESAVKHVVEKVGAAYPELSKSEDKNEDKNEDVTSETQTPADNTPEAAPEPPKRRGRGGRSKNDAAIIKELEKQGKLK